ncbi:MAG: low affinity iron permease family protein [Patescibacteria group bacterium]
MKKYFRRVSTRASQVMGSPYSFVIAVLVILVWWITGPIFRYSDTWQLMINTGTTIVTFLMVFLIQNTQNRDTKAVQIKLDELVRSAKGARNSLVNIEEVEDSELDRIQEEFKALREHYEQKLQKIQELRQKKMTK